MKPDGKRESLSDRCDHIFGARIRTVMRAVPMYLRKCFIMSEQKSAKNLSESKKELFEKMPVTKAILTLAIPTIISQLISVIYNIADTFYVGRTGNPYMIAGVSLALPVFLMTISFANLFGIGGGSFISRLMGAGRDDRAKTVSSFSFYGALAISLVYSVIVALFMDPILNMLGASGNTMEFARQYTLWVVVFGTPFIVVSAVESHLLRNTGYSTQASLGLSGGGILNMILDPIFMFILFPKGQEVLAAAVATFVSNVGAFIFLTVVLLGVSKKSPLSIDPMALKDMKKNYVRETFAVGIPSALLPGLFDVSNIVMNSSMAAHGDLQLAAMGIVMKVERLPNAIGIGISQGMLPLVAYNYSAGNKKRMTDVIRTARVMGIAQGVFFVILFQIFAETFVSVFLDSSAGAEAAAATLVFATTFLKLRGLASPFQFINFHSSYCMQAMGDGKGTILHAIGRIVVIYIPLIFLFDHFFGETGLALALPVGEALADILAVTLLRRSTEKMKAA